MRWNSKFSTFTSFIIFLFHFSFSLSHFMNSFSDCFFSLFFERGWAMIAHERIALRCSAYLWGVAIDYYLLQVLKRIGNRTPRYLNHTLIASELKTRHLFTINIKHYTTTVYSNFGSYLRKMIVSHREASFSHHTSQHAPRITPCHSMHHV